MTATAPTNGRPRKQLSDQLDRMDTIIDALAEALPEAVADATREGARQAIRDVALELLTNPEVRAMIAGLVPPPSAAPHQAAPPDSAGSAPGIWSRAKARVVAARDAAIARCRAAAATTMATVRTLALVLPVRQILAVGAAIGTVIGVIAYSCPHTVSAVLTGTCGAAAAIAAQAGHWLRRSVGAIGCGAAR